MAFKIEISDKNVTKTMRFCCGNEVKIDGVIYVVVDTGIGWVEFKKR